MTNAIKEETLVSLTIKAPDALDLLTGASVCIDAKSAGLRLSALYLSAANGEIIAMSTDRYRLIEGKLSVEGTPNFAPVGIMVNDVKRIIAALKDLKSDIKRQELTLSIAGDIVSVAINGVSLTLHANGEDVPPYEQLFTGDRAPVSGISFNPKFLADFGKVPNNLSDKKAQLIAEFNGENKPIIVKIPHDRIAWRALLMPMKVSA